MLLLPCEGAFGASAPALPSGARAHRGGSVATLQAVKTSSESLEDKSLDSDSFLRRAGVFDLCDRLRRLDRGESGERSVSHSIEMDNIDVEAEGDLVPTMPAIAIGLPRSCRTERRRGRAIETWGWV